MPSSPSDGHWVEGLEQSNVRLMPHRSVPPPCSPSCVAKESQPFRRLGFLASMSGLFVPIKQGPCWLIKLMIVTVDEQQKPVTSASIAILSICLQQTYSTPCACGSLCAHREPHAQGVLRISDSIGLAT